VDFPTVQKLLGHRNAASTLRYLAAIKTGRANANSRVEGSPLASVTSVPSRSPASRWQNGGMADDPMDDRTQYDKSVELLCKHGKYPKDCVDCAHDEWMETLERRQYDPPAETSICSTCEEPLIMRENRWICPRCNSNDDRHGRFTIDESNRVKREQRK
jgi:hypothetical protein